MAVEYLHAERGMRRMSDGMVVIDRHLYLTEDKTRVVEEGDPASRWLWASPGQEVDRAEAVRLGAVKPEPESAPAAASAEPTATEQATTETPEEPKPESPGGEEPEETKARTATADKRRSKPADK